ncbi:MAG: hypothetical protein ACPGJS_00145 [Flammeovirgaceae bacterium]
MEKQNQEQISFQEALTSAMDPYNDHKLNSDYATTTIYSPWLHKRCVECGHTFRLDDEVTISADGTVRHNSRLLPCSGNNFQDDHIDSGTLNEFYAGILETYPPPNGLQVYYLNPADENAQLLLAPPKHGFKRHECAICSHTLRPTDIIVVCPCHPSAPQCRVTIHWDPFRGLNCWGEWKSHVDKLFCPATSKRVNI